MGTPALIQVINELQEVFAYSGSKAIELPQIVVVGAQSSGKSSVLESLVGKSFLPRGSGLVTRCPIVLKMIHIDPDKNHNGMEEWCVFQHKPNEKIKDFNAVRQEIEAETERKAGKNSNIVNDPIQLTIYSPTVVTLTLVDLPGIVKVRTGDQPKDIEIQIQELILKYISNPNSIILAVTAANNDIVTSESIKYAMEADPTGDRTLTVITKLDLMDKGTDAKEVLNGNVVMVKLGIIGVVNRSQKDINDNKSVEDALFDEHEFLEDSYPEMASRNGTPFLAMQLSKILMNHIAKCLPDLENSIQEKLDFYEDKLAALGGNNLPKDKGQIMIQLITQFCAAYKKEIDGDSRKVESITLCAGAKIREICQTIDKTLPSAQAADNVFTDDDIGIVIRNLKGFESNADTQRAFQVLVKHQIPKLKKPTLSSANIIYKELKNTVQSCINDDMKRFPKLEQELIRVVNGVWAEAFKLFKEELERFIDIESAYVNIDHEDFVYQQTQFLLPLLRETSSTATFKENCTIARKLLTIYFGIFLKNLKDHFRKSLAYYIIYKAMDNLQAELINQLQSPEQIKNLIRESKEVIYQREETSRMIEALEKGMEIIERTRTTVS